MNISKNVLTPITPLSLFQELLDQNHEIFYEPFSCFYTCVDHVDHVGVVACVPLRTDTDLSLVGVVGGPCWVA